MMTAEKTSLVNVVSFLRVLASASEDGSVKLWDLRSAKRKGHVQGTSYFLFGCRGEPVL